MNSKMRLRCQVEAVNFQSDRNRKNEPKSRVCCCNSGKGTERGGQDEMAVIWEDFAQSTSCHGVRNIGSQTRPRPIRVMYALSVILSLTGLLASVFSLMSRVLQYNTMTRTEFFVDHNMTFPTITMCNICPFSFRNKNKTDPLYRLMAKQSVFGKAVPELDFSEPEFEDFFQRSTDDVLNEYFMELDMRYAEYDGENLTKEDFETAGADGNRCLQFNGHRSVAKNGPWRFQKTGQVSGLRVIINIKQDHYGIVEDGTAGVKVYITHIKSSPDLNNHGIAVLPGTSTRIAIKPHKMSFLPKPYKSFGSEYCLNGDEESPELVAKMVNSTFYGFQKCREQCVAYKASMECSCYHADLVVPGLRACTVYEFLFGCYMNVTKRLLTQVSTQCDCPRLCSLMQYDVTLSASQFLSKTSREVAMKFLNETSIDRMKENYLEIRVYFDSPLVWMEKHDPEYTFHNFMSSLGGQMGITIGASFITLIEFWELIFWSFVAAMRRMRGQGSAPQDVASLK